MKDLKLGYEKGLGFYFINRTNNENIILDMESLDKTFNFINRRYLGINKKHISWFLYKYGRDVFTISDKFKNDHKYIGLLLNIFIHNLNIHFRENNISNIQCFLKTNIEDFFSRLFISVTKDIHDGVIYNDYVFTNNREEILTYFGVNEFVDYIYYLYVSKIDKDYKIYNDIPETFCNNPIYELKDNLLNTKIMTNDNMIMIGCSCIGGIIEHSLLIERNDKDIFGNDGYSYVLKFITNGKGDGILFSNITMGLLLEFISF